MATFPRKIDPEKIQGYVYCLDFGPLAYEDNEDKEKLLALSELFREGIRTRGLKLDTKTGVPLSTERVTRAQFDALQVLWKHGTKNAVLNQNTLRQMRKVLRKNGKEILVLTRKDVHRLERGWFSWMKFWGK
ncbi:MAG: hypothetical protein AABX13_02575 [Nanoarchaeota archaeon]